MYNHVSNRCRILLLGFLHLDPICTPLTVMGINQESSASPPQAHSAFTSLNTSYWFLFTSGSLRWDDMNTIHFIYTPYRYFAFHILLWGISAPDFTTTSTEYIVVMMMIKFWHPKPITLVILSQCVCKYISLDDIINWSWNLSHKDSMH